MKSIFKKAISMLLAVTMLVTATTTVFAQDSQIEKPFVPKYNLATLEVFDYALLAIGDDMPIEMNSAIATVNANVYSAGDFKYKGSQLMLNGECNAAGEIIKDSTYANIEKTLDNIVKMRVKDYTGEVEALVSPNAKVLENHTIYHGNSAVIPPLPETATDAIVEVETATDSIITVDEIYLPTGTITFDEDMIIKGNLTVNAPILNLSSYIVAEGDIEFNTSLIRTTADKPLILVSKNGNITINSSYDDFHGIIYAPNGTVTVNSTNFSLNGKIIANEIVFESSSIIIKDSDFAIEWLRAIANDDKDQDGLDDEYELKCLFPNLLLRGIEINGIKDINPLDDFDGDGLNYLQEYEYDTNPFLADTDGDGLSDYDEIFVYFTNPNVIDTDSDGMNDDTEINCGLNPLKQDTDDNGILDCDEITTQHVSLDLDNQNGLITIPQAIITGTGDYSQKLKVEDISYNQAFDDMDFIVGTPFEFSHEEDISFEDCTLSFQIEESVLRQTSLDKLAIAWYDYDNNDLVLLETKQRARSNQISAQLDHFSTYVVIDQEKYYESLTKTTPKYKTEYKVIYSYMSQKWGEV